MEIVLLEYSIAGFLPVILAAVSATAVIQLVYGASPAFEMPALHAMALIELPHVMLTGAVMGLLAAAFSRALLYFSRIARRHGVLPRLLAAGAAAGLAGVALPQLMGIGYDTVNAAIVGDLGPTLLIALALGKLLTAAIVIGLGIPAGLIGPVLFIGAMAGGVLGQVAVVVAPDAIASSSLYALIGMGAMMGATLRAPLAALTALLELTGSPGIIFPGMLAIVIATLTSSEIFKQDSVFISLLRAQGLDARGATFLQGFDRVGIARVMDRRIGVLPRHVERPHLKQALAQDPRWIVIEDNNERFLLPIADLLEYLEREKAFEQPLDLLGLPATRLQAIPIELRATLRETLDALRHGRAEALCVVQTTAPGIRRYYGIVTRQEVDDLYLSAGSSRSA
jgi:CIC family chloride channel protein